MFVITFSFIFYFIPNRSSNYGKSNNLVEGDTLSRTLEGVNGFTTTSQDYGKFGGVGRDKVRGARKNRDYFDRVNN